MAGPEVLIVHSRFRIERDAALAVAYTVSSQRPLCPPIQFIRDGPAPYPARVPLWSPNVEKLRNNSLTPPLLSASRFCRA